MPEIEPGNVLFEQAGIKANAREVVLALQPQGNSVEVGLFAKNIQRPADVPDTLAIERLADQREAAANLNFLVASRFRPLGRPDAARADRREAPLETLEHAQVLFELGGIRFDVLVL